MAARKRRKDITHIIYRLIVANMDYVGITAKTQSTINKSLNLRVRKHFERARNEEKHWPLYDAFRKHGVDDVVVEIVEIVRGKAAAHKREVEIIKTEKPVLNMASAV